MQGWCHVREEIEEGISGVSVPLNDAVGRTVGAITAGTSPDRTTIKTVKTTWCRSCAKPPQPSSGNSKPSE